MSILYRESRIFCFLLLCLTLLLYGFALSVPLFGGTFPYFFLKWNLMLGKKSFMGISNYVCLFSDSGFRSAFLSNLKLGLFTIIGSNIFAFALAYLLNENIRAKGTVRSLLFIPNIISVVLVAFIWTFIFAQVLPGMAKVMGIGWPANINWFGTPQMASLTIIIVSIWQNVGLLMMIYMAGLQAIPTDIVEAARMNRCKGIRMIRYIQIPLLMPTFTINLFVSISGAFKAFDIPNAMMTGGPYGSTVPVATDIYQEAFVKYNAGYGAAKPVVLFLTMAAITVLQLYATRKREVEY